MATVRRCLLRGAEASASLSHVGVANGGNEVEKRHSVDDEPQLLVRQEGVEQDEAKGGASQHRCPPPLPVEGPRDEEEGEEEGTGEGRTKVPQERKGLGDGQGA